MVDHRIQGKGQKHRVPEGGSEGPWIGDSGGQIVIDGVTDDRWVLWGAISTKPTLSGPASYEAGGADFGKQVWIVKFTSAGTLTIFRDPCEFWRFLIHKTPGITFGGP